MTQKPQIQYVGQFYVHGSEAQALQRQHKKAKTKLPQSHVERTAKIYIDPVALGSIAVSIVMLVVMAMGAMQIHRDWQNYDRMKDYVAELKRDNRVLQHKYQDIFDLEDIRSKATGMGLVPRDSVKTMSMKLTLPEPVQEESWLDDLKWFLNGLLE